jgi:hypothetical protein
MKGCKWREASAKVVRKWKWTHVQMVQTKSLSISFWAGEFMVALHSLLLAHCPVSMVNFRRKWTEDIFPSQFLIIFKLRQNNYFSTNVWPLSKIMHKDCNSSLKLERVQHIFATWLNAHIYRISAASIVVIFSYGFYLKFLVMILIVTFFFLF